MDNIELIDTVSKAMRTAWQLGQTYWRQADSDFTSDHRRSDETQRKYDMLVQETIADLSRSQDAPRCQCCGYLVTESEHRGCLRAAERSQDVARVALNDEQRRDIQECIDYLTPAAKDFSDLGMVGMGDSKYARCIRVLRSLLAPQPPQAGASRDAIELLRKFMEYRDSDYVPNVLFDLARTIIDCAPAPAEPKQYTDLIHRLQYGKPFTRIEILDALLALGAFPGAPNSEQRAATLSDEQRLSLTSPLTPYGLLVRTLRIVAGTTLYDMSKALLTTPAKLSAMEFGRTPVTQEFAFDVSAYFDALGIPDTLAALKAALLSTLNGDKHE